MLLNFSCVLKHTYSYISTSDCTFINYFVFQVPYNVRETNLFRARKNLRQVNIKTVAGVAVTCFLGSNISVRGPEIHTSVIPQSKTTRKMKHFVFRSFLLEYVFFSWKINMREILK